MKKIKYYILHTSFYFYLLPFLSFLVGWDGGDSKGEERAQALVSRNLFPYQQLLGAWLIRGDLPAWFGKSTEKKTEQVCLRLKLFSSRRGCLKGEKRKSFAYRNTSLTALQLDFPS